MLNIQDEGRAGFIIKRLLETSRSWSKDKRWKFVKSQVPVTLTFDLQNVNISSLSPGGLCLKKVSPRVPENGLMTKTEWLRHGGKTVFMV